MLFNYLRHQTPIPKPNFPNISALPKTRSSCFSFLVVFTAVTLKFPFCFPFIVLTVLPAPLFASAFAFGGFPLFYVPQTMRVAASKRRNGSRIMYALLTRNNMLAISYRECICLFVPNLYLDRHRDPSDIHTGLECCQTSCEICSANNSLGFISNLCQ